MSRTGYNASLYNNMGYGMMSFRGRGNREEEPVICYIDGYVNIHI